MSMDIDSITFGPQGLSITYLDSEDVRVGGQVAVAHQIQLQTSHPDYREDAARLAELAENVVRNALEDWANTPSVTDDDRVDDEDDRGMGE